MNGDDDGDDDDDDDDVMLRPIDKMTSCNQQDRHSSYHTYFEIRTVRLRFSNRPNAQRPEPKRTRSEYSIQPITQNPPPSENAAPNASIQRLEATSLSAATRKIDDDLQSLACVILDSTRHCAGHIPPRLIPVTVYSPLTNPSLVGIQTL